MALSWLPRQESPMSALLKDFPDSLIKNMMERKKLSQQEAQHKEEMELRKAAASRAAQAASDAHKYQMWRMDPMREINQLKLMQEYFGGQGGKNATHAEEMPSYIPSFKGGGQQGSEEENILQSLIPGIGNHFQTPENIPQLYEPPLESNIPSFHEAREGAMQSGFHEPRMGNMESLNKPRDFNTQYEPSMPNPLESFIQSVQGKKPLESFIPSAQGSKKKAEAVKEPIMQEVDRQFAENRPEINEQAISELEAARNKKGLIDMDTIKSSPVLRGWFKKHYGIDPGAPEAQSAEEKLQNQIRLHAANRLFDMEHPLAGKGGKGSNTLEDKKALEKYKHELAANDKKEQAKIDYDYKIKEKEEDEKIKERLADSKNRKKIVADAKKDLPHLEETLRSLEVMEKIAQDPKNDNMFGHWLEGNDVAAKRSSNPNTGVWQSEGLDPIIDAELKMSLKGNQLALNTSLRNKANFAENRLVALTKVRTQKEKMKRRIKYTKKISESENDYSKMSDEELHAIVGGG